MNLAFVANPSNSAELVIVCFPQEYITSTSMLSGQQLIDAAANVLNSVIDKKLNPQNEWFFYRCTTDITNRRIYLNEQTETTLNAEYLYPGKQNFSSYKYFKFPTYTTFRVENAALNIKTRSFLSRIAIYRDYIPKELIGLKYK